MEKRYVGYSEYYHDAGMAIVNKDGTVEFASQAERYSGRKYDAIIPPDMWRFVNKEDHVTFYEDYELRRNQMGGYRTHGGWSIEGFNTERKEETTVIYDSLLHDDFNSHHVSHNALAYFTRPWTSTEDTVLVSVDGSGELESVSIMDHNFNVLHEVLWPQSLGCTYGNVVKALGMKNLRDEYIIMGLSAYGKVNDKLYKLIYNSYHWYESDEAQKMRMKVQMEGTAVAESQLSWKYSQYIQRTHNMVRNGNISKEDASATVQKFFEDEIMDIMRIARQYGSKLVYSGGCAQNVVANSMIRELFDEMHISVNPTDAGSALGCATMTWHKETGGTHLKDFSPYLGHNIERDIDPKEVAEYLAEHKVCGVANGRAEYGPRALGNRSLLADVRYDVKDTVNDIKRRHRYRPFAPAILSEYADEYFEGPMNEYMQYTAVAKHPYKSVTHVDGTARVQLVKPDCKSVLRQILEEYHKITGVPMLLNTSLNIRNKPMVNTVEDAIEWERNYNVKVF